MPPGLAGELSVVYFPQLGYLITIAYEPEVTDAGKYGQFGWDFQVRDPSSLETPAGSAYQRFSHA